MTSYTRYRYSAEMNPADQRTWAILTHLSAFVLAGGPLIAYLILKDRGWLVRGAAAGALNFQLTLALELLACFALMYVLVGFLLFPVVLVLAVVFPILAAVTASRGEVYRYPLTIPFVR